MEYKKRLASFKGLECYKLTNIHVSDIVIGHGSYANVFEVDYMGLRCAGKKIHDVLLQQGNRAYQVRRFEEECSLLSEIRHPNIVQFLGVCFQNESTVPVLVMEYLPTNLTSCIDKYGILPQEISYSILHDVALGLCYLHSEIPPIVHRDLSSNNVLLASNMTAKISDLGVAKIFNLTPLQVSRMTQTPGTPAYMPPEVMTADPIYNKSVDEFSFGVMMVHVLSGSWPEPQCGPIRTESGKLIPVSEVERREKFLQAIGEDHPLIDLIKKCLDNDSQRRAHVSEIVDELSAMVRKFPRTFANELEMLSQLEAYKEERQTLDSDVQRKELKAAEVHQELEKCKRENEKLKEEISKLNELLAKDNDLISNTIQVLQHAQEQKQKKLQELRDHRQNDRPHPKQKAISSPESDKDIYQENISSSGPEEIHRDVTFLEDTYRQVITPKSDIYDEVANEDLTYQSCPKAENESKLAKPLFMYPVYSAKFSYVAHAKEDLTVQEGDQMFLIDGTNKDWWYMILASTRKAGFVPTNYITEDVCKLDKEQIQMLRKLGSGSAGETWEGFCYGNTSVAVKILSFTTSPEIYLEEAALMSKLCHENVAKFYAVCIKKKYFIIEFLTCGSLLQYLSHEGKSMRLPQLMESAAQIADGMAYLEAQNYAHGNLAARNIFLTEHKICKVADYGIIPLALEDRKNKSKVSWPDKWTAPETVVYEVFTTKSDVWSYGIVLYEIITCGKTPYPGMTNDEVLERVPDGYRLPCPPACPRKLHNIMLSCWNINADDRPAFSDLQLSITYFTTDE